MQNSSAPNTVFCFNMCLQTYTTFQLCLSAALAGTSADPTPLQLADALPAIEDAAVGQVIQPAYVTPLYPFG